MPVFEYTARSREGSLSKGRMHADTERELREALRAESLFLTNAAMQREEGATGNEEQGIFRKRVKLRDMVVASRQLATLVRAGIPVVEAIGTLADQSENPTLVGVLREVRMDVLAGDSLSEAMRKHPAIFNQLYTSLVEAGETGGVLERVLDIAADTFDKEAELRERVKAAMTYPIIVLTASVLTVAFMLAFIVPTFAKVYVQFRAELPLVTQALVRLSDIMLNYSWFLILGIVGAFFAARYYNKTDQGRKFFDTVKLKIPLIGKVLRKVAIARFAQTFSSMMEGGVPILRALQVSANTSGNVIIRDAITQVAASVKEGELLSKPLEESGQFPVMVTRMIASGEDSGNLPEMLEEINRFYDRDIRYSVDRLTKLMEPLMTVAVGGIVLFVLLALYYPVFNLTNVIRRD